MKQTEAVDFNNTENQNTSKEKMDMSDKMITLDRKDKNLIYENTENESDLCTAFGIR